jgi:tetratricopeptide (TPR) repeat protein
MHISARNLSVFLAFWAATWTGTTGAAVAQEDQGEPRIIIHRAGDDPAELPITIVPIAGDGMETLRAQIAEYQTRENRLKKALLEARKELADAESGTQQRKGILAELDMKPKETERRTDDLDGTQRKDRKLRERAESDQAKAESALDECRANAERLEELLSSQKVLQEEKERELLAVKQYLAQRTEAQRKAALATPPPAILAAESGSDPRSLLTQGYALLGQGQYDPAASVFQRGQAQWPDESAFRIGIASCHYEQGNLDVAESLIKEVIDADSDIADAHGILGTVLWQKDDLRGASKSLARAIRIDKENDRWRVYHGMVLYSRGKHRDALRELQQAVKINALNGEGQFNLAVVLAAEPISDFIQARIHYEEAVRLGSAPDKALEQLLYPE